MGNWKAFVGRNGKTILEIVNVAQIGVLFSNWAGSP